MISQPALMSLNATWQRLMRTSAGDAEPAAGEALQAQDPVLVDTMQDGVDVAAEPSRMVAAVDGGESRALAARQEGQANPDAIDASAPLAANERRARAAALRAMAFGRDRRFDAARAAFAEAAGLDPLLDLTRTPAFWKLERAAHEAAIDAYLQVGRERDAAVLRARVQSTFRPKPVRPRPQVVLSP
ncbi:MAG: hypothetical protein K0S14_3455 [Thermomicrobiales bacterium]|nr:hypothetical protein [Thermomicrobiales bacterium]MDF2759573.1 hypothetical protein [Thermomicrobiales bacterium]